LREHAASLNSTPSGHLAVHVKGSEEPPPSDLAAFNNYAFRNSGHLILKYAFLRELFLQRLPVNVRMILASASVLVLPELSKLVDAVIDVSTPTSTQVAVLQDQQPHFSGAAPCDTLCPLEDIREQFHREMQNLSVRILAIATRSTSPHKRRLSTRPRPVSPAATRAKSPDTRLCWYYRTFGEDARNCVFPCSASGNALTHH
ncbi:hypothetical protein HPB47_024387, partial [Ixodes persulcatus]